MPGFFTTRSRSSEMVLLDLSCTGARMKCDLPPARSEELVLTVGRSRTFATVAWSGRGQCGVTFDMPLPLDEVAVLRNHAAEQGDVAPEVVAALDDWLTGLAR